MTSEQDTNYADIENLESIIKIGTSGAPSISDLSPNSDWKSFPPSSYSSCYGLPYQDHNYGAPPPPTPPPSPGNNKATVTKKKTLEAALKSIKPIKTIPIRKPRLTTQKDKKLGQVTKRRRRSSANVNSLQSVSSPVTSTHTPSTQTGNDCDFISVTPEDSIETEEVTGDYSDSITRCICNYTHDDGYMICCDQCQVWQHIDCMGIDRANIPEEYSCEECMPRKIHKARARLIQKNKKEELFKSLNEDENANSKRPQRPNARCDKQKLGIQTNNKSKKHTASTSLTPVLSNKRRAVNTKTSPALRNKRNSISCSDNQLLSVDGDAEESPWCLPYEQASDNQYSADIQESLKSYRPNGTYQLDSVLSELNQPRCQLRLLANGRRGLEVDNLVPSDQALIEFKGKVMLQQQFIQENDFIKRPQPFVLFYNKWDDLDLCVDASSFGNEARFVQRSCVPNAEVRHIIENGQVHLVIFSVKELPPGSEVTIPFDFDFKSCEYFVECACIRAQCPVRKAARRLKKNVTQGSGDHGKVQLVKSTRTPSKHTPVKREAHEQLNVLIPENHCVEPSMNTKCQMSITKTSEDIKSPTCTEQSAEEKRRLSREDRKIEAYMKAFEKLEKREERRKEALQRINEKKDSPEAPCAPQLVKEEPGSQTIQHKSNVSKPLSRRRRNKSGPAQRRRTTSSTATASSQPVSETEHDDNSNTTPLPGSCETSLDSAPNTRHIPAPSEVGSTYMGTINPAPASSSTCASEFRFPKTKKHLLNEWYHEKGLDKGGMDKPLTVCTTVHDDSIDFVKTNSSPGSSWAHLRRNSMSGNQQPTHTHATHHTPIVPTRKLDSSMGSAKKRWLKQAMEEHGSTQSNNVSLSSPVNGQSSPPHPLPSTTTTNSGIDNALSPGATQSSHTDFVTPLKKRRMARESLSLDSHPASPDNTAPTTPVQHPTQTAFIPPPDETANHASLSSEPTMVATMSSPTKQFTSSACCHQTEESEASADDSIPDDSVPEPVRSISPHHLTLNSEHSQDIPTTVIDATCLEQESSVRKTPRKLRRHYFEDTVETSIGNKTILSPREPRTLTDMMHQPGMEVVLPTAPNRCPDNELRSPPAQQHGNVTITSPTQVEHTKTEQQASSLTPDSQAELAPTDHSPASPRLISAATCGHDTMSSMNNSSVNTLNRSTSLIEHGQQGDWRTNIEALSEDQVHLSSKPEDCGDRDLVQTTTPPQKKKVSLLEYRKRMKTVQAPRTSSSSLSAPTTPAPQTHDAVNLTPITLPALPLFNENEDQNHMLQSISEVAKKPAISLDERLKMEFGLTRTEGPDNELKNGVDESGSMKRDTPPPPPPMIPHPEVAFKTTYNNTAMQENSRTRPMANGTVETPLTMERTGILASPGLVLTASPQQSSNGSRSPQAQHKKTYGLRQGSLGAVMLGEPSSPISNMNRELAGCRQYTPNELPKKYR